MKYQILKMLSIDPHSTGKPSDCYEKFTEGGEMVKWNADDHPDWIPVKELLKNKNYIIYQVKKLSTGEILTVGQSLFYERSAGSGYNNGEEIVKFEQAGKSIRARLENGTGWLLCNTDAVYSAHSKRNEVSDAELEKIRVEFEEVHTPVDYSKMEKLEISHSGTPRMYGTSGIPGPTETHVLIPSPGPFKRIVVESFSQIGATVIGHEEEISGKKLYEKCQSGWKIVYSIESVNDEILLLL